MNICLEISKMSHCISKKVAVIAVRDRRIVATGINGTISGAPNCDECFENKVFTREEHHEWSLKNEVHAEINMIAYCAKHGISLKDCTIFSTFQPCSDCSKALAVSGIKEVIYLTEYEYTPPESTKVLESGGVKVTKFSDLN